VPSNLRRKDGKDGQENKKGNERVIRGGGLSVDLAVGARIGGQTWMILVSAERMR
jgi:hypothetical protein